jgi:protein-disulfide isomerase
VVHIFWNFPLPPSMHPQAQLAAEAAECAGLQGQFWAMHDRIFLNQQAWSGNENALKVFQGFASDLGLDTGAFASCLAEHQTAAKISNEAAYAQQIGVSSTPTFLVNGQGLLGAYPYAQFQQLIDAALAESQP